MPDGVEVDPECDPVMVAAAKQFLHLVALTATDASEARKQMGATGKGKGKGKDRCVYLCICLSHSVTLSLNVSACLSVSIVCHCLSVVVCRCRSHYLPAMVCYCLSFTLCGVTHLRLCSSHPRTPFHRCWQPRKGVQSVACRCEAGVDEPGALRISPRARPFNKAGQGKTNGERRSQ